MKTNVIIDGNNILYRTFHANNKSGEPDEVVIGLCIHSALLTMNKYFMMFDADDMVVTFDSYSWRKVFTKDLSKCVTNKKYKGHRRTDQTPKQEALQRHLDQHIDEFCDILRDNTGVVVLRRDLLEGDDLMAAYCQMHRDEQNIVVSGDRDMTQLLRYDGVKVINPADDKPRTLSDWNDDADLFLFEKCVRGEPKTNDNIQSAYPRVRKTKIVSAYGDEFERENFMNNTFQQTEQMPDGSFEDVEYRTGDLMKENRVLMDLTAQPKSIKKEMVRAVLDAKETRGRYNHFKFLRFCAANELEKVRDRIEDFVPMLSVA